MKKNYTAPEAEILCFRPMEELASDVTMDNLLDNYGGPQTGVTEKNLSDVFVNLWG